MRRSPYIEFESMQLGEEKDPWQPGLRKEKNRRSPGRTRRSAARWRSIAQASVFFWKNPPRRCFSYGACACLCGADRRRCERVEKSRRGIAVRSKESDDRRFPHRRPFVRTSQGCLRQRATPRFTACTLLGSSLNDNARLGQGGLSYFSSTDNGRLMRMLDAAGYNSDRLAAYYYKSFTPLMDSGLNVQ